MREHVEISKGFSLGPVFFPGLFRGLKREQRAASMRMSRCGEVPGDDFPHVFWGVRAYQGERDEDSFGLK